MEPVLVVGWVFFPLDKQLELLPGCLSPTQEEHLVRLAVWMPFRRAGKMLEELTGVQVSEATVRRHTQEAGAAYEQVQTQQSQAPLHARETNEPVEEALVISSDGAYVPLLHGRWAEVRTLAIGTVDRTTMPVHTRNLSYFSRMVDAETFVALAEVETRRRGLTRAKAVCAVMDGALWLQGFTDMHRPDAVRILDFPHASQRFDDLGQALQEAGHQLPKDALARTLHLLKHHGPRHLLGFLHRLQTSPSAVSTIQEPLTYLHKREALMDYPGYQRDGWPIGSGMVESANKTVMQARLKGAGMHWAVTHVNPMLALRTAVCNDRWPEAWNHQTQFRLHQRIQKAVDRASHRQEVAAARLMRAWWFLLSIQRPSPSPSPPSHMAHRPSSPAATLPGSSRPSAHHPWKRGPACRPRLDAKN